MSKTKIEWADRVWNPVTGCTKVSEGCRNCYAERMAKRLVGRCGYSKENPFGVTLHSDRIVEPLKWRKPSRIFVCSMGDLFHEDVPDEFILKVFNTIWQGQNLSTSDYTHTDFAHTFLILTKRPLRMKQLFEKNPLINKKDGTLLKRLCRENLYLGVSVEDQETADERIPILLQIPAVKRFVSIEPVIGPVDLKKYLSTTYNILANFYLHKQCSVKNLLHWVILGGESGPKARPMHPDWARSIRLQCQMAGVPFFFKQWGAWYPNCFCPGKPHPWIPRPKPGKLGGMFKCGKKTAGLDGREQKELPSEDEMREEE